MENPELAREIDRRIRAEYGLPVAGAPAGEGASDGASNGETKPRVAARKTAKSAADADDSGASDMFDDA